MIRLLTAKTARAIDSKIREKFGISTLVLMENAGAAVAREILESWKGKKKIAIFCGKGNNGGDGFVAARHLLTRGIKPDIFLAGKHSEVNPVRELRSLTVYSDGGIKPPAAFSNGVKREARVNLEIIIKLGLKVFEIEDVDLPGININKYGLVVDALLGVGLAGPPRGIYAALIQLINSSRAEIIAVDIPSGLDATSGKASDFCVKADKTITFIAQKRGMVIRDGLKYCGKIITADLGQGFKG
ncbi:MAG: NAD(P)H-hydrate epimerase [Candidatus Omnitrophota bacterium]